MSERKVASRLALCSFALASLTGCGSRTGLLLADDEPTASPSATPTATPPVTPTATPAPTHLPPLTVSPPATPAACAQLPQPSVFLVTQSGNMLKFDPPTGTASVLGHLRCPTTGTPVGYACPQGLQPFSMAVDRTGIAYVIYCDGELFEVASNLTCTATNFRVPSGITPYFGMAFSQDQNDANETLFVATDNAPSTLAAIQPNNDSFQVIGLLAPVVAGVELTGTGAGDLFAFYTTASSTAIGGIDKATAQVTSQLALSNLPMGAGWAFAFWGGDFYTFTAPTGVTLVTRVSPADGSQTTLSTINDVVVGAGVSTCAPQQ